MVKLTQLIELRDNNPEVFCDINLVTTQWNNKDESK